ncbi:MAG: glycoside hydrolase family 10 protein, partial [Waterburya sp.]
MKERIAKSFDIYANKLVQFSQTRGRLYWWVFLFILALTLVSITPFPSHSQLTPIKPPANQICQTDTAKEIRGVWLTNI